jgi:glycosyltransferase involved in cell wall biosynthesis
MKAGIYNPYLDTLGGGERYCLTLAEWLIENNWKVDIFWKDKLIKGKVKERFNFDLEKVNFVPREKSLLKRFNKERLYDLLFFFSDGSVPLMFAKKNILHFQIPFTNIGGRKWLNKIKLKKINFIVCNSFFTKKFIDQEFGINSLVVYPPVDVEQFKPKAKENIILAVGRFSQLMQAKRQDVLIHEFKRMAKTNISEYLKGWRLVLAGGTDVGGKEYFNKLKKEAEGCPIEFLENPSFNTLRDLYGRAKIFWSASGFGIDEEREPERVEHFGISTVEAMATGCVPLIVNKGGHKEIIEDKISGFLWNDETELLGTTLQLIKEENFRKEMAARAIERSKIFSKNKFCQEFEKIISE